MTDWWPVLHPNSTFQDRLIEAVLRQHVVTIDYGKLHKEKPYLLNCDLPTVGKHLKIKIKEQSFTVWQHNRCEYFSFYCMVWMGAPVQHPFSQGLNTHKQSDLFKLCISEFCYLITSGGQHISLAYELWRTFFMSEVDGGSGEELIINPQ